MSVYYRKIKSNIIRYYHLYNDIKDIDLLIYLLNNNRLNDYISFISCIEIDSKIIDIVISYSSDLYYLYELLYYIKRKKDKDKVLKVILNSRNTNIKYLTALSIKDIDKDIIIDSIIKDKSSKYLYLCALNIKDIDINKIYSVINSLNDIYYRYLFEKDILHKKIEDILDSSNNLGKVLSYLTYEERLKYLIYLYEKKDIERIKLYKDYILNKESNIKDGKQIDKKIKRTLERK